MGGPDPSNNGDINVASFHVGESSAGTEFGHAHPDFEKAYMAPYAEFLLNVYSPVIRRSRALNPKTQEEDVDSLKGEINGLNLINERDLTQLHIASDALTKASNLVEADASPVPLPTAESAPKRPEPSSGPALSPTKAPLSPVKRLSSALTIPPSTAVATVSDPVVPSPGGDDMLFVLGTDSDNLSELLASVDNFDGPGVGPNNFQWNFSTDFDWMQSDTTGLFLNVNNPLSFEQLQPSFNYPPLNPTGVVIPPFVELPLNGLPPLPYPSSSVSPFASDTENQTEANLPLTKATPPDSYPSSSVSPFASDTENQTEANLPLTKATPPDCTQPPTTPPSACPALVHPVLGDASVNHQANYDETSAAQPRSRSGRQIIPSTRAEKMNEIGSLQKTTHDALNMENIPPDAQLERPAWLLAAEAHLTTRDLGDAWAQCVKGWSKFEGAMGANAKGSLPSTKSRPDEWTKWVAKSRQGVRAYDTTPPIEDPLEFGYAVMAWWKAMQPAFRDSSDMLPKAVYDSPESESLNVDEWAALRKGGPNGMVSVMTLLVWWGQRMKIGPGSQWQETSEPHWRACIEDVHCCLEKMMPVSRKRKAKGTAGPSKRAKTTD
ncbi:hypothetical protein B0H34DRAFT_709440 [Crassisporium funariophilum]|nr:hypothetical protein B0H34DRAFT_727115 [Crassisporium funariophilum]KAF8156513.1 hypothetical protein B0H34DRAFT_709440 [Crassisporium funariophilum]